MDKPLYVLIKPPVRAVNEILHFPLMTLTEQRIIREALLLFDPKKPLHLFEYGTGYSTVFLASFLKGYFSDFHIDSLDADPRWHNKISKIIHAKKLSSQITLHIESDIKTPEGIRKYVEKPMESSTKFDVIFVDGRLRRRCLEAARKFLNPSGIVILHDAERVYYHEGLNGYPYGRFIDGGKFFPFDPYSHRMWIGSLDREIPRQVDVLNLQ